MWKYAKPIYIGNLNLPVIKAQFVKQTIFLIRTTL